jgi:hypothetical protein
MMNVYNGNATLDADGRAVVALPEWFEALNRDFRYQLTPIGAPGPNLHVAKEIAGNRFEIAGGAPGARVSWQVTGVRQDPWAQAHRIEVESEKSLAERGTYLTRSSTGSRSRCAAARRRRRRPPRPASGPQASPGRAPGRGGEAALCAAVAMSPPMPTCQPSPSSPSR